MESTVAYFCMEYGLNEELHTYAGGLGILAGDHLKGAADLGLALVGIGILWQNGYTTQLIGEERRPYDVYPHFHYDFLEDTGITVSVQVAERTVRAKAWRVTRYGNAPLYLLDTDLPENAEADRQITARLYGDQTETRVAQEIVLGIGGVRLLRALGRRPSIYHFNEGHAILAATELLREAMAAGASLPEAWAAVRQQVVFTTHTPVAAGNESHPLDRLMQMRANNGLSREDLIAIGGDPFNMTVAGLRLARIANGVSARHGETSRQMWQDVSGAAPIIHITNGVHRGTWQDAAVAAATTPEALWQAHDAAKRALLAEIYARTGAWLSPETLLVGFARRAAPYKRSGLVFHDLDRIEPLLQGGRLNLVFSGKAHPRDDWAKGTVARLVELSERFPGHVVFLPNYEMRLGRLLTRGCDVWLNNPVRPLEASGTSGMKAAMNGVLNLSILDGWWPEACQDRVNGWAFGGEPGAADMDAADADALYAVLLGDVLPTYYDDRPRWLAMMRASITATQETFSVHRMLREYIDKVYAAESGARQSAAD